VTFCHFAKKKKKKKGSTKIRNEKTDLNLPNFEKKLQFTIFFNHRLQLVPEQLIYVEVFHKSSPILTIAKSS
jgi:hypothetical protein